MLGEFHPAQVNEQVALDILPTGLQGSSPNEMMVSVDICAKLYFEEHPFIDTAKEWK